MEKFSFDKLREFNHRNNLGPDIEKITKKWEGSGLLEGLSTMGKDHMARLLENQMKELVVGQSAKEVLLESAALSTGGAGLTSSGQVAGFTGVAFPIVRKVFANLIANEIVSVQPMNLPTGLLFYFDFTYGSNVGGDAGTAANKYSTTSTTTNETYTRGNSVYNNPVGAQIRSGSLATGGQHNLVGQGFSRVHVQALNLTTPTNSVGYWLSGSTWTAGSTVPTSAHFTGYNARHVSFDPQVEVDLGANVLDYCFMFVSASEFTTNITGADLLSVEQIAVTGFGSAGGTTTWGSNYQGGGGVINLRKENKRGDWDPNTGIFTPNALGGSHVKLVIAISNTGAVPTVGNATTLAITASTVIADTFSVNSDGSTLTIPSFETDFATDGSPRIPDVDLKIEAVNVTAQSRKLRARWSPEMAQDVTAYFNVDIEQEMSNLLSEMITLDIDREILMDLLTQANAANYFWSRMPGRYVNKLTGSESLRTSSLAPGPSSFTGGPNQWYQVLVETISEVANVIYTKTLRGAGNFIVTSPQVCTMLEHCGQNYKASMKFDADGQSKDEMNLGMEVGGTLNGRYVVYKDPYFPVNKILVGYKGKSFLEAGYVYAPYVPLILTPVVYDTEHWTPRRAIWSRYGRKMVRADYFGTITVLDMSTI